MDLAIALAALAVLVACVVGAALALAAAALLEYRLATRLSAETRATAMLGLIAGGTLLSVVLTTRTLDEAQLAAVEFIFHEDYAKGFAASRWLSLLLVGAATMELVRGVAGRASMRAADPALPLLVAMAAYHLGTIAVQAFASQHPGFSHKDLYLPLVLAGLYAQRVDRLDRVIDAVKWMLFALTAGSLATLLVAPDFVIHRPEPGLIPGIDWRFFGLTSHANAIGPAALVAIVLEIAQPSRTRRARFLHLSAAVTVFVLAQSRTAWVAAAAAACLVCVPLAVRTEAAAGRPAAATFPRAAWTIVACSMGAVAGLFLFQGLDMADYLRQRVEVGSLNGRLPIWEITLDAWRENPLFGFGPSIWSPDRQWQFHMFHVGHAHNQVVQTLGEAGLAGLLLLLLHLAVLVVAALRHFVPSRGLLVALLVVLLARWVTEAPMRSEGLLSWAAFHQALLMVVGCHWLRCGRPEPRLRADLPPIRLGAGWPLRA